MASWISISNMILLPSNQKNIASTKAAKESIYLRKAYGLHTCNPWSKCFFPGDLEGPQPIQRCKKNHCQVVLFTIMSGESAILLEFISMGVPGRRRMILPDAIISIQEASHTPPVQYREPTWSVSTLQPTRPVAQDGCNAADHLDEGAWKKKVRRKCC